VSDVDALIRERAGYARRGLEDRVAACDAEIKRLGGTVEVDEDAETPPAKPVAKASRKQTVR
jgi:hypothetical protein